MQSLEIPSSRRVERRIWGFHFVLRPPERSSRMTTESVLAVWSFSVMAKRAMSVDGEGPKGCSGGDML